MDDIERNDVSLRHEFEYCQDIIKYLENGKQSTKDLQDQLKHCEEKLKLLTKEVAARLLFNSNEGVDELPTSSLNYLFLPYYLAMVTQNVIVRPEERLSCLDRAKIYLRDFLERLKSYSIIEFDLSELNEDNEEKETEKSKHDVDLSKQRESKLRRFQQEKQLKELVQNSESELYSNTDDDELMRELTINRLRLAAMKSMDEIRQIDQERPMVEHMLKIQMGQSEALPKRPMNQFEPIPYVIARDKVQKKVFGLGYPSIPTMTVSEWYDDMMKNGRFGAINPSSSENNSDLNAMDEEAKEEQERVRLQRWDEYKDHTYVDGGGAPSNEITLKKFNTKDFVSDHRRGWGNMHNKG